MHLHLCRNSLLIWLLGIALLSGLGASRSRAAEHAWIAAAEWMPHYRAPDWFRGQDNDIRMGTVSLTAAWPIGSQWQILAGTSIITARGTTETVIWFHQITETSNATGFSLGPGLRWSPFTFGRLQPLADASVHVLATSVPFPRRGSNYNVFARAGVGLAYWLNDHQALEFQQCWGHVSNGNHNALPGPAINPGWDGRGLRLALRQTF